MGTADALLSGSVAIDCLKTWLSCSATLPRLRRTWHAWRRTRRLKACRVRIIRLAQALELGRRTAVHEPTSSIISTNSRSAGSWTSTIALYSDFSLPLSPGQSVSYDSDSMPLSMDDIDKGVRTPLASCWSFSCDTQMRKCTAVLRGVP